MGPLPQTSCCGILGGPVRREPPGHSPRRGTASQQAPSRCTKQAVPGEATRGARRKGKQCTQLAMNLKIRSWLGGFSRHLRLHQGGKGGSSSAKCNFHSTLAPSSSHAGLGGPGEQSLMRPSPEVGRRDPAKLSAPAVAYGRSRAPGSRPVLWAQKWDHIKKILFFHQEFLLLSFTRYRCLHHLKERGCPPQSFYRRGSGLLALAACLRGLPFRTQTLGSPRASVPGCLFLAQPVFQRRVKPTAELH